MEAPVPPSDWEPGPPLTFVDLDRWIQSGVTLEPVNQLWDHKSNSADQKGVLKSSSLDRNFLWFAFIRAGAAVQTSRVSQNAPLSETPASGASKPPKSRVVLRVQWSRTLSHQELPSAQRLQLHFLQCNLQHGRQEVSAFSGEPPSYHQSTQSDLHL